MASSGAHVLSGPPTDGITKIIFSPDSNNLLVSSWDTAVRLYDTGPGSAIKATFNHKAAVLDCCFLDDSNVFSGGLDKVVKLYNITTSTEKDLGKHEKAVRSTIYNKDHSVLLTFGWDATMKLWDHRQPTALISSHEQPAKVFAADARGHRAVVGCAARHVLVWDLRQTAEAEQKRESSLKYQTRAIGCFVDGTGYALASTEGRVAMEYFDPDEKTQARKYAFKCHRATVRGVDTVYPVNALAFHPVYGTFASGGCDGMVNVWDGQNKKRLCQFRKYPTSIASLAFNKDGTKLAIASSYTFEEGEKDHPVDEIFVRSVSDNEVKPKAKKAKK